MARENEELELYRIFSRLNKTYRRYVLSILKGLQFAQEQALRESKHTGAVDPARVKKPTIDEVFFKNGKDSRL